MAHDPPPRVRWTALRGVHVTRHPDPGRPPEQTEWLATRRRRPPLHLRVRWATSGGAHVTHPRPVCGIQIARRWAWRTTLHPGCGGPPSGASMSHAAPTPVVRQRRRCGSPRVDAARPSTCVCVGRRRGVPIAPTLTRRATWTPSGGVQVTRALTPGAFDHSQSGLSHTPLVCPAHRGPNAPPQGAGETRARLGAPDAQRGPRIEGVIRRVRARGPDERSEDQQTQTGHTGCVGRGREPALRMVCRGRSAYRIRDGTRRITACPRKR